MRLVIETQEETEVEIPIVKTVVINDFTKLDAQNEMSRLAQVQSHEIFSWVYH